MDIKFFGHSCFSVTDNGTTLLVDPGNWSNLELIGKLEGLLISHQNADHFDIDKIQQLVKIDPELKIYGNSEVLSILEEQGLTGRELQAGKEFKIGSLTVNPLGENHAEIHSGLDTVKNIGYWLNGKIWYPGDAYTDPKSSPEILMLPIVAPWTKISETLSYLNLVKPKICIPVHNGFLKFGGPYYRMVESWCLENSCRFMPLEIGEIKSF